MTLLELRDKLDYSFIRLWRNADGLEYEALFPGEARMTEELKEELREHKPELLQALDFEEEADRILLESTRRLAAAWPEGCTLSGPALGGLGARASGGLPQYRSWTPGEGHRGPGGFCSCGVSLLPEGDAMSRQYTHTRVRGLAPWKPQKKTLALLDQVQTVLDEYRDHLPLTARQVFYRLVGAFDYPKTESASNRLGDMLNRARRAGMVPFRSIRDDGVTAKGHGGFHGMPSFWQSVESAAETYHRPRLEAQPNRLELWCEAAGMVPQLLRVTEPYGVPVFTSGGFNSVTAEYDAARRYAEGDAPAVVLHVGDHDPSGCAVFDSLADDVQTLVKDLGAESNVTFIRCAVTPEQIARYGLPQAPAKKTDKRGNWQGGTVQAEALSPDQLADEVREVVLAWFDTDTLAAVEAKADSDRRTILATLRDLEVTS